MPLSGSNSGHRTQADCFDPLHNDENKLYVEVKLRAKHSAVQLWDDTKAKADKEGRTPVVCLCEKNRKGFWILIHEDDLVKL